MTGNAVIQVAMPRVMVSAQARTPPMKTGTHNPIQKALLIAAAVAQELAWQSSQFPQSYTSFSAD